MPHIRVRNDTKRALHAAFYVLGVKGRHHNSLQAGESYDGGDFPSFIPQSFAVRNADEDLAFHDGECWHQSLTMAAAGATGCAAAGVGLFGMIVANPVAMGAAGALFSAASKAGQEYEKEFPGLLKRVKLWVGWEAMELVIRDGDQGLEIWSGGQKL